MTSPPLDCKHGWQRREWHDIAAFGQYTRSDDVGRGMTSPPLDCTHGRTTSGVACHHSPRTAKRVERHWAWHAIITVKGAETVVGVGSGMPSSPLDGKHSQTVSGVACHHRLWTAHTVKRRQACHAIIDFGQHTRSNDVGRGMPSSPLGSTNSQTTSGMACHHRLCAAQAIGRC